MNASNPPLPPGYSPLPPGHIASVVTCLEMNERPRVEAPLPTDPSLHLEPFVRADVAFYRTLYRSIGEDWLWFSRLVMPSEQLRSILEDPHVETYILQRGDAPIGLLELDFREAGSCELAFFGVVREAIGQGVGRVLMAQAIDKAWAKPIKRFWVHTCSFDHPSALRFYRRAGFQPYAVMIEVHSDPRLTGHLPRDAAPHVPVIEP